MVLGESTYNTRHLSADRKNHHQRRTGTLAQDVIKQVDIQNFNVDTFDDYPVTPAVVIRKKNNTSDPQRSQARRGSGFGGARRRTGMTSQHHNNRRPKNMLTEADLLNFDVKTLSDNPAQNLDRSASQTTRRSGLHHPHFSPKEPHTFDIRPTPTHLRPHSLANAHIHGQAFHHHEQRHSHLHHDNDQHFNNQKHTGSKTGHRKLIDIYADEEDDGSGVIELKTKGLEEEEEEQKWYLKGLCPKPEVLREVNFIINKTSKQY